MRPLQRSITFWSGACFLALLLWAWVDSYRHPSGISLALRPSTLVFGATAYDGRISFRLDENPGASPVLAWREPRDPTMRYHFDWEHLMQFEVGQGRCDIPLSLFFIVSLGLWLVFIRRRGRISRDASRGQ